MLFLFAALIEFAFCNSMSRRKPSETASVWDADEQILSGILNKVEYSLIFLNYRIKTERVTRICVILDSVKCTISVIIAHWCVTGLTTSTVIFRYRLAHSEAVQPHTESEFGPIFIRKSVPFQ